MKSSWKPRLLIAGVCGFASALLGGCEFGNAPGAPLLPPKIAYASPAVDTVGRGASHAVASTGGAVSFYGVFPPLPAGLSLDSLTGLIAGVPVAAQGPRAYNVIAVGPNGADTAVLRLWAVAPYNATLPPSIVYESPVIDTVGAKASHPAFSLGGAVTGYTLLTPLPAGLTLNASTGLVSGTPAGISALADYGVVATGPGGKDTATLRLATVPGHTGSGIYLTVSLAAANGIVLDKASALQPLKMVVTLTSSFAGDAVVRDTILAGASGFSTLVKTPALAKLYELKPLRHWTVNVKTLDVFDSTIHEGSALVSSLLAGEMRAVTIYPTARFATYRLQFSLPDSLGSATGTFKAPLTLNRFRVLLDGAPVRDTVKGAGSFASKPAMHTVDYDYVRPNAHVWKVEVYGILGDWPASRPLFTGTLPSTSCASCAAAGFFTMVYTGPGSPSDPAYDPGSAGAGITTLPTVFISQILTVVFSEPVPPGGVLPKRAP